MKQILSFTTMAALFLGLMFASPASAQQKPGNGTCKKNGQCTNVCPNNNSGNKNCGQAHRNFKDANGDGVCDNAGTNNCRQRLRDGSCTNVKKTDGAGNVNKDVKKTK
jgi:hypothetical protein